MKISNFIRNLFLIPFLFAGHVIYELGVGYWLFGLAGGITYHPEEPIFKTHLGGIEWAFETLMYAPGSYLLAKSNIGPCMWDGESLSLPLLIIATALTAIATAQAIQKTINKDKNKFGKFYWRLIVMILGWVFIPLPVEMTLTYEFTVLC